MGGKFLKITSLLMLLGALALAVAGCGDDGDGDAAGGDDAGATQEVAQEGGCTKVQQPQPKSVDITKPKGELDPDKTYFVTFNTNCGEFTVRLDAKDNPVTASSFKHLADEGVYDDTWFHRIVPNFVIQGGDPSADGTGSAGYKVKERPTGKYRIGTVAMAKSGAEPAGTSSSQFFVVIGPEGAALDPDYAIAGRVVDGMETVKRIAALGNPNDTTGTGAPNGVALIESATSVQK